MIHDKKFDDEIVKKDENNQSEISEIFKNEEKKNQNNVSANYQVKKYEDEKEIIDFLNEKSYDIIKDEHKQNDIYEICTKEEKKNLNEDNSLGDGFKKTEDYIEINNDENSNDNIDEEKNDSGDESIKFKNYPHLKKDCK